MQRLGPHTEGRMLEDPEVKTKKAKWNGLSHYPYPATK